MTKKENKRKPVKYYNGYEINSLVLKKLDIIDLTRIKENITMFNVEEENQLKPLYKKRDTNPQNEYIILGEDWYIAYIKSEDEIEIKHWVAINTVENKFAQTTEMMNSLKKLLLENAHCSITSTLRHSTSYPFYKKLLNDGLIEEQFELIDFEDCSPELEKIKQEIFDKYDSLEAYLNDEFRDKYEEYHVEDFIYHEVSFNVTQAFTNRYKKSGR